MFSDKPSNTNKYNLPFKANYTLTFLKLLYFSQIAYWQRLGSAINYSAANY